MNRDIAFAGSLFLLLGSTVGLMGCPGEIENPERFACDVEGRLFPATCSDSYCHGSKAPAAGLDLESKDLVARLSAKQATETCPGPLLVPGSPEESVIYRRLTPDFCGDFRMPFGETPLSEHDIACVRSWIEGLAGAGGSGTGSGVVAPSSE